MSWRSFCIFGILWSVFWILWDYSHDNIFGAKFQFACALIYAAAWTYHSIKSTKKGIKKND